MSQTLVRTLIAAACVATSVAACARSDAGANDTSRALAAAATAAGTVSPAILPHDTITDQADLGRIMGAPTATLWVIMASDFQCPFCKAWHDANFQQIVKNYVTTGRIRLAYYNYPMGQHKNAIPAAEAAMCAAVQNKFWPMHDALFASQTRWDTLPNPTKVLDSLATAVGVNAAPYKQCVAKHLTLPLIQADHDRAKQRGVSATPTFFVGQQVLVGTDKDVAAAIDAELAKASPAKKPGA